MAFKITKPSVLSTESAEALFRDLHTKKVPGLLAHQADILRDYHTTALDAPDVALQGPTGSGKTLVGVLLAEWRRRRFNERVLYLCPTIQLVNQVKTEAITKYGVKVTAFTGSSREYVPADKTAYRAAETVAVSTYSSLFNTHPFFDDPEIIILDDTHAAENYIPKLWSLRVDRVDAKATYDLLATILRPWIGEVAYARLRTLPDDPFERSWVDKLPSHIFAAHQDELATFFDEHASAHDDIKYPWKMLKGHLHACHLYFSAREILVRPLIPPTESHAPFAGAKQRVYMSATLGEGGDLERITGREAIQRLSLPKGWDEQGIGRRFFLFPESALTEEQQRDLLAQLIRTAGRALALVPDEVSAKTLRAWIGDELQIRVFDAREIEASKEAFVQSSAAVAVLANRYDGIDLPESECRLLVVQGLPSTTNLQERFFVERLSAIALLNDRILTRVTQAVGRCTRSATDYAAIVILGEQLHRYLLTRDRRQFMHPELQAEVEFGIEQSRDATVAEFLENFGAFLAQDEQWEAASEAIIDRRRDRRSVPFPGSVDLRAAVKAEVEYNTALWNADFEGALDAARRVLTVLTAPELRGYRALWNYLAGTAALYATKAGSTSLRSAVRDHFQQAATAAQSIPWLRDAVRFEIEDASGDVAAMSRLARAIERAEARLLRLGVLNDRTFDAEERRIWEGLSGGDPRAFERAHAALGNLVGFDAGHGTTKAAPDAWWCIDDDLCIVFEDHSGGDAGSALSVDKARQAASHPDWIRANVPEASKATIIPVVVTPVSEIDRDAQPHLKDVRYWQLAEFRTWAREAIGVLRNVRRTLADAGDLDWRQCAAEEFDRAGVSPSAILTRHLSRLAANLPTR